MSENKQRLIDGDMLLKDLREDCSLMRYNDIITAIESRKYYIPSNQGEATRLREALELIEDESSHDDACVTKINGIAQDALSSHTEDTGIQLRPEVKWFAEQMEEALRRNDHKGGWSEMSHRELSTRLNEEIYELELAYYAGRNAERVIRESADVANFAMMIADNIRMFLPGINTEDTDHVGPSKSSMGLMLNTEDS